LQIGTSMLMLADEAVAPMGSPQTLGGTPFTFILYVPDVDAAFQRAVKAGATVVQPLADKFYGDRTRIISAPFGYQWALMTHIEDVSDEEMAKRAAAEHAKMGK